MHMMCLCWNILKMAIFHFDRTTEFLPLNGRWDGRQAFSSMTTGIVWLLLYWPFTTDVLHSHIETTIRTLMSITCNLTYCSNVFFTSYLEAVFSLHSNFASPAIASTFLTTFCQELHPHLVNIHPIENVLPFCIMDSVDVDTYRSLVKFSTLMLTQISWRWLLLDDSVRRCLRNSLKYIDLKLDILFFVRNFPRYHD